ncbi:glycosyltransferase family 2 protein [Citrobacter portucalensis]|uniref:glycosyltransferase family 2 protein n=1 Tax=Citrobacter portucalensis TaxID=1639133 RepID=UPI003CFA381A
MVSPVISVILPVYNVSEYLPRCLDSLLSQSFTDFEIIAVNDGSTDSSLEILHQYSEMLPMMKIINQQNQGLGGARNAALEIACGDYIYCVDSDDAITPDALNTIVREMSRNELDVLFFSTSLEFSGGGSVPEFLARYYQRPHHLLNKMMSAETWFNNCIRARKATGQGYSVVVWGYAWRRSQYAEKRFQSSSFEDEFFTTSLLLCYPAARVKCLADRLYLHMLGHQSITTTTSQARRMLIILDTIRQLFSVSAQLQNVQTVECLEAYVAMLWLDAISPNFAEAEAAFSVQKMIQYMAGFLSDLYLTSPTINGLTLLKKVILLLAEQGGVPDDPEVVETLARVTLAIENKKRILIECRG